MFFKFRILSFCLLSLLPFCLPKHLSAVELDPFPLPEVSREQVSISFFREERPSFYWLNAGVPDSFFNPVSVVSSYPNPVTYSVRTIEYGIRAQGWVTDQLNLRVTLPFEGNALEDTGSVNSLGETIVGTHSAEKIGDIELGATYLIVGNGEKGNYIGVNGWYRFPTGSSPFYQSFPLLGTGKGAGREALGIVMDEEAYGFSLFQSLNYETTDPVQLNSGSWFGSGTFNWPDNWFATGKISYQVFHRSQRVVSFYYQLRARFSGLMKFNGQVLGYGENGNSLGFPMTTDQLAFSTIGMDVQVDRTFLVDGQLTYFPWYIVGVRPNQGWLFTMGLDFKPI